MATATLSLSSKNYSSWSFRAWLMARMSGIKFSEIIVPPEDTAARAEILLLSPSILVPCLTYDGIRVWDTLAIGEFRNEIAPKKGLLPKDRAQRAHCRSICGEMHSGFAALRSACPMNIEASLPHIGARVMEEKPEVRADLARIIAMWTELLEAHGGPLLFRDFTIADAYFAPVCMRIRTYGLPVTPLVSRYIESVSALPGVAAWIADALAEQDFRDFEEPYRLHR